MVNVAFREVSWRGARKPLWHAIRLGNQGHQKAKQVEEQEVS